jgi:hypothetical protein
MKLAIAGLILVCAASASAQKLTVTIINRQDNDTEYTYVVPGYFDSTSNSNAYCYGSGNSANCSGSTTTSGSISPEYQTSFQVHGATFTLQLPDGRAAVVNCKGKFKERMAGPAGNQRDCRIPLVNNIQAEFHGDKAKLEWVVSVDGKKTQSETYKIVAILRPAVLPRPTLLEQTQRATIAATTQLITDGQASHCAVATNPAGAEVYVDGVGLDHGGKPMLTPTEMILKRQSELCGVKCPTRVVVIKMAGYKTVEKTIVPDGKDVSLAIILERE